MGGLGIASDGSSGSMRLGVGRPIERRLPLIGAELVVAVGCTAAVYWTAGS